MALFYLTNDLMFSSRVTGFAQQLGLALRMIGSLAGLLTEAQTTGCQFVLLDLALPGIDPRQTVAEIRTNFPTAKIVAYGPHVHEELLQAAAEAGCEEVLSRGQFHQQIERVLRTYAMS